MVVKENGFQHVKENTYIKILVTCFYISV